MSATKLYGLRTNEIKEIRVTCQYCIELTRISKDSAAAILQNRTCPTCETVG